jgi:hypothetical protein
LHALIDDGANHDYIGTAERSVDYAAASTAEELNVSGNQRANAASGGAADQNHFAFDTMLFEKPFFLGNPQGRVDGREGAEADA